MGNFAIRTKLLITGIVVSLAILLVIVSTVFIQQQSMIKVSREESLQLAYSDLDHIVKNLYTLAESHQEVTQKNLVSALKVAHNLVDSSGGISFSDEKVGWKAINQYTKAVSLVDLPKMNIGDEWFGQNYSLADYTPLVDSVQSMLDVTCTIFQRMNTSGDMLRVATNVINGGEARAIGTYIPSNKTDGSPTPVISTVLHGETYRGRAFVVDRWYITAYEPIKDENQNIIGVLYVGIPQENIKSLRRAITQTLIGTTGYVTVMDSSGESIMTGNKNAVDSKLLNKVDTDGIRYIENRIKTALELKGNEIGQQQFTVQDKSQEADLYDARFVYFAPWDWIITAEANSTDFTGVAEHIASIGTRANVIIAFSSLVLVAFSSILWYVLANSITKPIKGLVRVFEQYANGDITVRAKVSAKDEIGYFAQEFNGLLENINHSSERLAKSQASYQFFFEQLKNAISKNNFSYRFDANKDFEELVVSLNKILEELEKAERNVVHQNWVKNGESDLNAIVSGERNLGELCRKTIAFICKYTGAQVGVFSVLNEEKQAFDMVANYAYTERKGSSISFKQGEGLGGQAAFEKEMIIFSEVPEDYVRVESSLGHVPPRYIVATPLVFEEDVKGVIELGTVADFTEAELGFIQLAANILSVAINTAVFNQRLEILLSQTREQALQLEEGQEELRAANEELEGQTDVLKKSEAKLQLQQEELQASNEEMEEKTEILEGQKAQIAEKNKVLRQTQIQIEEKAKQLELATKYKSEFLANMSHELRTPLNSLLILANLLADNDTGNLDDDQVESANAIYNGGKTLLRLINDILDLSKIEAGKIELSPRKTSIKAICSNINGEFSHMAKAKGLGFSIEVAENLPEAIFTDDHRLNQILRNLIGNGIKFTDSGAVKLAITKPSVVPDLQRSDLVAGSLLAFSVIDSGIGISKDNIKAIFEKFTQADGSISRRHGGTGLGLSISRELASLLGGELSAVSNTDEGSTFTLYLPVEIPDAPKTIAQLVQKSPSLEEVSDVLDASASPKITGEDTITEIVESERLDKNDKVKSFDRGHKTMLIIEDDKDFSSVLAKFFDKHGYDSIIANDGETGIKMIIEHQPTAIVLDIGLPGIDGWAVLKEVKGNPATRHIPVHVLSAFDESHYGLENGAVGYLTKPLDKGDLQKVLTKIESVLDEDVRKLLIVEDDQLLRETLLKIMKTKDIEAKTAHTGKQAIELMKTEKFDCMVLDLGLPDISGFDLLEIIKNDPDINMIPVIIYTGRELTRDEAGKLEQYASSIILKSAASIDRLLDETALFMHRVEANIPEDQRKMIQQLCDKESVLAGKNVLVVDDDMRNAFALNKFLRAKGMEVTVADNGKRAIDMLQSEDGPTHDIVLMDIMMPVMDGHEAMERIRQLPRFEKLPILALTAKAMDSDRQACIEAGANDYLSKPVDLDKLLTMLRVWLYN